MRVEWAQCAARVDRWEEEVVLLQEEMRRVVHFLEWRSTDWFMKAGSRMSTVTPVVLTGLSAYVNKQGLVYHNLAIWFSQRWHSTLVSLSLPVAWTTVFLGRHGEQLDNLDLKKRKLSQAQVSDIESDETPSENDGSGHESTDSFAE